MSLDLIELAASSSAGSPICTRTLESDSASLPSAPVFRVGSSFWAEVPADARRDLLMHYADLAGEIIGDHDLPVPDRDRLELVVRAALEARLLFYSACIQDISRDELDEFFLDFVVRAVAPGQAIGDERAQ